MEPFFGRRSVHCCRFSDQTSHQRYLFPFCSHQWIQKELWFFYSSLASFHVFGLSVNLRFLWLLERHFFPAIALATSFQITLIKLNEVICWGLLANWSCVKRNSLDELWQLGKDLWILHAFPNVFYCLMKYRACRKGSRNMILTSIIYFSILDIFLQRKYYIIQYS